MVVSPVIVGVALAANSQDLQRMQCSEPFCSQIQTQYLMFPNTALLFTCEHVHCNAIIGGCEHSNRG